MADFVFSYGGNKEPNIHYHTNHYQTKDLTLLASRIPTPWTLESRYLKTMQAQLASTSSGVDGTALEGIALGQMPELEGVIEQELADYYNTAADTKKGQELQQKAYDIREAIASAYKSKKVDERIDELANAIMNLRQLFNNSPDTTGLLNLITGASEGTKRLAWKKQFNASEGGNAINTTVRDILNVKGLIQSARKIWNSIPSKPKKGKHVVDNPPPDPKVSFANRMASIMQVPTEALTALMPFIVYGTVDDEVIEALKKSLVGRKPSSYTFKGNQSYLGAMNNLKAADYAIGPYHFMHKFSWQKNKASVDVNTSYVSVKYYVTPNAPLRLVSTSASNSVIMKTLHNIYGDTDESNYHIYNSLVISNVTNKSIERNFNIIRSNLINEHAEKFIAGFDPNITQRLLIVNFKAYPVLSIIQEIVKEASEKAREGIYGEKDSDLFTIVLDGKRENVWVGTEFNPADKMIRIKRTKEKIDKLEARGEIRGDRLQAIFGKYMVKTKSFLLEDLIHKT